MDQQQNRTDARGQQAPRVPHHTPAPRRRYRVEVRTTDEKRLAQALAAAWAAGAYRRLTGKDAA